MSEQPRFPGLDYTALPEKYGGHPLMRGAPFFTVPKALLDSVVQEVGQERFDSELLSMERTLSDLSGDHGLFVGFWRGLPIRYSDLRPSPLRFDDAQLADFAAATGRDIDHVRRTMKLANGRSQWTAIVRRGFSGWLMTNRQFLSEQAAIVDQWADDICPQGIPVMGAVVRDASAHPGGAMVAEGQLQAFVQAFEEFFIRWRLIGMPAPSAPVPLGLHMPVTNLPSVLGHMRHAGTTFYISDIFPVPSRDELRKILEECLRYGGAPEHLDEWGKLVQSKNPARNQLHRYARIFEMQHYLRALYGRHSKGLYRKQSSLIMALASFLDVNEATIANDLRHIDRRLGREWYLH